ncbi:uncharacterized protein LOC117652979 [Thrips palmi]|uniref:Uncharacterized protein LOC117652979 n=1 Tax=Thrips palmi TaxID=161013 RepID=A0A6P9A844_THRPL|nr:uncharacterized protein LOC117652979 [Thrips palmi]
MTELAHNPDVRDMARAEVERVLAKHGGKLTYEALGELTYMDRIIDALDSLSLPHLLFTFQTLCAMSIIEQKDVSLCTCKIRFLVQNYASQILTYPSIIPDLRQAFTLTAILPKVNTLRDCKT